MRRSDPKTLVLYARGLFFSFRWTIVALVVLVCVGGVVHHLLSNPAPRSMLMSFYAAWMALSGENILGPTDGAALAILFALYPVVGFVVVGEGVVRLAMLVASKQHREGAWMQVKISTYRDHVIVCGVGHLGCRVIEEMVRDDVRVVAIEKDPSARFLGRIRAADVPILIRDMSDDDALVAAGVEHARAIVIASNNDMANIEVALDARRMNATIRVVMRLFDQQIAQKISGALAIDVAFSSSALSAPIVANMALSRRILASFSVGGVPYATEELVVSPKSAFIGCTAKDFEDRSGVRVLATGTRAPAPNDELRVNDGVTVCGPAAALSKARGMLGHLADGTLPRSR